jgi:hypothetical protein
LVIVFNLRFLPAAMLLAVAGMVVAVVAMVVTVVAAVLEGMMARRQWR